MDLHHEGSVRSKLVDYIAVFFWHHGSMAVSWLVSLSISRLCGCLPTQWLFLGSMAVSQLEYVSYGLELSNYIFH